MEEAELREEIRRRYDVVEKIAVMDFDQLNHQEKIMSSMID